VTHSLDYRKSAGGFIHGFRYTGNCRVVSYGLLVPVLCFSKIKFCAGTLLDFKYLRPQIYIYNFVVELR